MEWEAASPVVAGQGALLVSASPCRPVQPVADAADAAGDQFREEVADFVDGQRDQPVAAAVAVFAFVRGDDGEDGVGEHREGGVAVPGGPLTDLMLVEATLPRPEREGPRGHLTPAEAGEHGRRAGARRLVITHISDELDLEWARKEAEREFGAPVDVAAEGAVYDV